MIVILRLLRKAMRHPPSMLRVMVLLLALIAYGTTGFMYFEVVGRPDLAWTDALWWTIVTLTTVGYGDISPITSEARFFVGVPLMIFGIGLLGYVLSLAAAALVDAKTREISGMGKVRLENHIVVVNLPSVPKMERILDEILHPSALGPRTEVVLIDEELAQLPPELVTRKVHFVRGNPTRDETLSRAAIEKASHAVILSRKPGDPHSDEQVITVALAIEARSKKVRSVVECVDPSMEEILRKTGCDSIVCTARFDAHFVCAELAQPGAQEVIDHLLSTMAGQQLVITKLDGAGRSFADIARACSGKGHVAIGARINGAVRLNPAPESTLGAGDELVTIGPGRLSM